MKPYYQNELVTIYHGKQMEIFTSLSIESVDLVLTDPPYEKSGTHKNHLSTVDLKKGETKRQALGFDGLTCDELIEIANKWISISKRWCIFTCDWKFMNALDEQGMLIRFGIWRKPNGAPQFTGDRPGMGWEPIAICHRKGKKRWNGGGKHAFYTFPIGSNKSGHPTGKPLKLFVELLSDFSDEGELILDPFLGSGTTAVACMQLNRRCIGIEKEEKYCEISAKRCEEAKTGLTPGEQDAGQMTLF